MRRDSYENLNGPWQYAITASAQRPAGWDGEILVPYAPECRASRGGAHIAARAVVALPPIFCAARRDGRQGAAAFRRSGLRLRCAGERPSGGRSPGRLLALYAGYHRAAQRHRPQQPVGGGAGPHRPRYTGAGQADLCSPAGCSIPPRAASGRRSGWSACRQNYIQSLTVTPDYDARTVTVKVHTSAPGGAVNLWAVVRAWGRDHCRGLGR